VTSFSIAGRLRSFCYAGRGLVTTLKTQHNAWLHLSAAIVAIIVGAVLGLSLEDWKWLTLTIALVWCAETMNTAFEFLCDVVSPEFNEAVKHAKDIAAGAVLICAGSAVIMGVMIFGSYLL